MKNNLLKISGLLTLILTLCLNANAQYKFHGKLYYHYDESKPVAGVSVYAVDEDGVVTAQTKTNNKGDFFFSFIDDRNYMLEFKGYPTNFGPCLADAIMTKQHIDRKRNMSRMEKLAADVDQDGDVDMYDYKHLMQFWMEGKALPKTGFVFDTGCTKDLNLKSRDNDINDPDHPFNWVGTTHCGDCIGILDPLDEDDKKYPANNITIGDIVEVSLGSVFSFDIQVNESLIGLGMELQLPEGVHIMDITSGENTIVYKEENGMLKIAMTNNADVKSSVINLNVTAKCVSPFTNGIINLKASSLEAYSAGFNTKSNVSIEFPKLKYVSDNEIKVNAYPNPVNANTSLEIYSEETGSISYKVYDIAGKELVVENNLDIEAGVNHIALPLDKLNNGVNTIVCSIVTESTTTNKVIKLVK